MADDEISISRAKLESITVYDVMEEELELIEAGSPSSLYLNFSIALLSVCVSLVVTLLATKIENDRVFFGFLSACFITGIIGIILLILWYRLHKDSKKVFVRIRSRKSPNSIRAEAEVEEIESLDKANSKETLAPKG